jgi:hypothetical protein
LNPVDPLDWLAFDRVVKVGAAGFVSSLVSSFFPSGSAGFGTLEKILPGVVVVLSAGLENKEGVIVVFVGLPKSKGVAEVSADGLPKRDGVVVSGFLANWKMDSVAGGEGLFGSVAAGPNLKVGATLFKSALLGDWNVSLGSSVFGVVARDG